jgi:hypothetical protein
MFCSTCYFKKKKIFKKKKYSEKNLFKIITSWALIVLIMFLATLKPVDYSRFYTQWNREYLVSKFGIYIYQANDLIKSIERKWLVYLALIKHIKNLLNIIKRYK